MTRIIPWTLPPVNGGSQGGYTPQPTPTPAQEYYNIDNLTIVRGVPAYGVRGSYPKVNLSGIETIDVSGVASIVFICEGADGSTQADADAKTKNSYVGKSYSTAAAIADPNGSRTIFDSSANLYWAIGKVQMVLYNGNGEVLKIYTLTDNLDGA